MASSGKSIRGSRIGAGPMGESDRGVNVSRQEITYYCQQGHVSTAAFAMASDTEVPLEWDCPRCGMPAGQDADNPPSAVKVEPYRTHLAYVKERRSDEQGDALLAERLSELRAMRGQAES